VYLVFNTLFNLPSGERQADCFRNVARVLTPDGAFVLECFVPDRSRFDRGQRVDALEVTDAHMVIEAARHHAVAQRVFTPEDPFRPPRGSGCIPSRCGTAGRASSI
jgi:hypothetical protein